MSAAVPSDVGNLAPEDRGALWELAGASNGRVGLSLTPEDALEVLASLDHRLRNLALSNPARRFHSPYKRLRSLRSDVATALAMALNLKPSTNGRPF